MHFRLISGSLNWLREDISLSQIQDGSRVNVSQTAEEETLRCEDEGHDRVSPKGPQSAEVFVESCDRSDPANGIRNQHFAKNLAYLLHRPGFQNHSIETVVGKVRHDRRLGITAGDNQL
jgi:hypothetical protein